jgi:hypothetical protein
MRLHVKKCAARIDNLRSIEVARESFVRHDRCYIHRL